MTAPPLRVLSISLDRSLLRPGTGLGDAVARHQRLARKLGRLAMVIYSPRKGFAPVRHAPNFTAEPTCSLSRVLFPLDAARVAARLAKAGTFDLVTCQDPFTTGVAAWRVARRFGLPLNVQVHFDFMGNDWWEQEKLRHRPAAAFARWMLRKAATIRVGTTRERAKFVEAGFAADRVFCVPVAVDVDAFEAAAKRDFRAELLGGPFRRLVAAAGRMVYQKDFGTLLKAAALLPPDVLVAIAGDGPQKARLAAGAPKNVRFLGQVAHGEVRDLFRACDVFALSSVYEGTGLVMVEAAAARKPIVATDVAGAADVVLPGRTGFVVPVKDSVALAARLAELLDDPHRAAAMGQAGREHVRATFGPDRTEAGLLEMWRRTAR
ncbi:MAG: glycosyltransferase family 4 protein [Planctomycetia bacterium]|nr:glycosyltransferase family 4 protein [Planctomycetia bacterium]